MTIRLTCDCDWTLSTSDGNAGKQVRCPACGRSLLVPFPQTTPTRPAGRGVPAWVVGAAAVGGLFLGAAVIGAVWLLGRAGTPPATPVADARHTPPTPDRQHHARPDSFKAEADKEGMKAIKDIIDKDLGREGSHAESRPNPEPRAETKPPAGPGPDGPAPKVSIEKLVPAVPVFGEPLSVTLGGSDPDGRPLRYQYRTDADRDWQAVKGNEFMIFGLKQGPFTLQVRALNSRDVASPVVERSWTVRTIAEMSAGTYRIETGGLVKLDKVPPVLTNNRNTLVKMYREELTLSCSSFWPGWEVEKILDGDLETSWFSAADDAAALGTKPWVQINFKRDVPVRRVTILGNREPAWLLGFTILEGEVTLYDARDRVLERVKNKGTGNFRDFDFRFEPAVERVRKVRFSSLADQGNQTVFKDIAIAEMQVE
jgi:hypothetical protein